MHQYGWIVLIALTLFTIFRRVRRNIGWQVLLRKRLITRTVIFIIIGLIFLASGAVHPISLISDVIGLCIGVGLAYYSSAITRFERRDHHWYYLPNIWIGSIVSVIFLGRLLYRFIGLYSGGLLNSPQAQQSGSLQNMNAAIGNSWTAGLLLIMFAYYVVYYLILLRKQKQLLQSPEKTDF